jgi:hypothetical protein
LWHVCKHKLITYLHIILLGRYFRNDYVPTMGHHSYLLGTKSPRDKTSGMAPNKENMNNLNSEKFFEIGCNTCKNFNVQDLMQIKSLLTYLKHSNFWIKLFFSKDLKNQIKCASFIFKIEQFNIADWKRKNDY